MLPVKKPTVKKDPKKRPSPTAHAADTPVNTQSPGSDGFIYICTERANKTKYWRKTILLDAKPPKIKGNKTIAVGEVSSPIVLGGLGGVQLKVNSSFYEVLKKKPKYISKAGGNAYIFGDMPSVETGYHFVGYHGNDVAQTGILDLSGLSAKDMTQKPKQHRVYYSEDLTNIFDYNKWLKIYMPSKKVFHDWDERKLLNKVQADISSRVLFVGTTHGGDVGANVYVHLNAKKEIDSLVIDNGVFL